MTTVSEQNKRFISRYLKKPIEVCNPYPKDVKKRNLKRNNRGLYVGRLDPDKNIKRVLNFGLRCPYFERFIIIGDGTLKNYVRQKAKRHKKIIHLGKRDDVDNYYSQCRFLVHLPDSDPHPCTTMEAAVCGCFPIISKGVGSRYLFDNVFIINNPDNFREINERIAYINKNEIVLRRSLNKSVKRFPTREKSIKEFKDKFESVVYQIIKC